MSEITATSANSGLLSYGASNINNSGVKEQITTEGKNTFLKPATKQAAETYLSNKSRIEASPMAENIKIAIDVVA